MIALEDIDVPGNPADHRVVVAMSGGVDSSLTAAVLARAGYDVVGITLQLYDHGAANGRKGSLFCNRACGMLCLPFSSRESASWAKDSACRRGPGW